MRVPLPPGAGLVSVDAALEVAAVAVAARAAGGGV